MGSNFRRLARVFVECGTLRACVTISDRRNYSFRIHLVPQVSSLSTRKPWIAPPRLAVSVLKFSLDPTCRLGCESPAILEFEDLLSIFAVLPVCRRVVMLRSFAFRFFRLELDLLLVLILRIILEGLLHLHFYLLPPEFCVGCAHFGLECCKRDCVLVINETMCPS
jgi:hypothetical protein